jgi:hypothetical protein
VPNIFVLNIARWGVREFCIAIVAVNTAALQPSESRPYHQKLLILCISKLLTENSVSQIILDKRKTCKASPAEAQQLRIRLRPASTPSSELKTTQQPSRQLDISWTIHG